MAGIDGEVVPGHVYSADVFRDAMSGIRAAEGSREFTFYAFDHVAVHSDGTFYTGPYGDRLSLLEDMLELFGQEQQADAYHAKLVLCPTVKLYNLEQVWEYEARCLAEGWEGAMLRRPDLPYKFGRSTNLGGHLIKLKRYEDAEAVVVGYEPWYQNQNEATQSPLGYTVRSAHQANKVPLERLGAWLCELATDRSVKFAVGVMQGVTHGDRDRLWQNRDAYIGRTFKFKHQGIGGYDVPRQPVFLNWRDTTEF
jgi:DNA ligase-1